MSNNRVMTYKTNIAPIENNVPSIIRTPLCFICPDCTAKCYKMQVKQKKAEVLFLCFFVWGGFFAGLREIQDFFEDFPVIGGVFRQGFDEADPETFVIVAEDVPEEGGNAFLAGGGLLIRLTFAGSQPGFVNIEFLADIINRNITGGCASHFVGSDCVLFKTNAFSELCLSQAKILSDLFDSVMRSVSPTFR